VSVSKIKDIETADPNRLAHGQGGWKCPSSRFSGLWLITVFDGPPTSSIIYRDQKSPLSHQLSSSCSRGQSLGCLKATDEKTAGGNIGEKTEPVVQ
jgi:hypothetical protein